MTEANLGALQHQLEMLRIVGGVCEAVVLGTCAIMLILFVIRPLIYILRDHLMTSADDFDGVGASHAETLVSFPDGSRGGTMVSGQEANFLLFLLDDHIRVTGRPMDDALSDLRERLFQAHEHPDGDDDDDGDGAGDERPADVEIERRFLVSKQDAMRLIGPDVLHPILGDWITQGYLATDPMVLRIRRRVDPLGNEEFVLTAKGNEPGATRTEKETVIDPGMGQFLLDSTRMRVDKSRFRINAGNGLTWELDMFHDHPDLFIAEIELPSEDTPIPTPDWLGMEITGDRSYSNVALAVDVRAPAEV